LTGRGFACIWLIGLLVGTSACSRGENNVIAPPSPSPTSPMEVERHESRDLAIAKRSALTIEDLPGGFVQQRLGVERKGPADPKETGVFGCLGERSLAVAEAVTAEVTSGEFVTGEVTNVSSSLTVFEQTDSAARAMDMLRTKRMQTCLRRAINKRAAGAQASDLTSTFAPLKLRLDSDEQLARRLKVSFVVEAQRFFLPIDVVFVREGRSLTAFTFGKLAEPFPRPQEKTIIQTVLRRLAKEGELEHP
jgi:hypothetical protein